MLIRFTIENYRSFCEPVTLDMTATRLTSAHPALDAGAVHVVSPSLRLLNAAALYGANASGKSNLIKAISLFKRMVRMAAGVGPAGRELEYQPFALVARTEDNPTRFEMELHDEGTAYRYGFSFDSHAVRSEYLYQTHQRESMLFTRDGQEISFSRRFREGRGLAERTRPAALFLSVVAQFNGSIAQKVVGSINRINVVSGLAEMPEWNYTFTALRDEPARIRASRLVSAMDTAIRAIAVQERSVEDVISGAPEPLQSLLRAAGEQGIAALPFIRTTHGVRDQGGTMVGTTEFDLAEQESAGTTQLVMLAPPLLDTLDRGKTLVVDEFDARLHPGITTHIMKLFNSAETNPHGAQLIVATHGVHLLARGTLRRDQVWFVEKDEWERSRLYSLAEFKTRKEDVFDRQYLLGRYGAVPILSGLQEAMRGAASP